jgi:hypothetical protein
LLPMTHGGRETYVRCAERELNHLSSTITDVVLIPHSFLYAMHIRLLNDTGRAVWALYRHGKTVPTPTVVDPRAL